MFVIELNAVCLYDGDTCTADRLSFAVRRGETVALLGPAGAGKCSVLSMLSGLLCPKKGEAQVLGYSVEKQPDRVMRTTAFVPKGDSFSPLLCVRENIELACRLHGRRKKEAAERAGRLMAAYNLLEKANAPAHSLSRGDAKRLSIACAVANEPALLLLHEPTAGLDRLSQRELLDMLCRHKGKHTVVFSTQNAADALAIADRIAVLAQGKLLAFDTAEALLKKTQTSRLEDACTVLAKGGRS